LASRRSEDGSISKDEWKGQARAFDSLDANHDGALSPQELRRAMRRAAVRRRR
jgi:Ca2+-binding EF-hand superfamily protein